MNIMIIDTIHFGVTGAEIRDYKNNYVLIRYGGMNGDMLRDMWEGGDRELVLLWLAAASTKAGRPICMFDVRKLYSQVTNRKIQLMTGP